VAIVRDEQRVRPQASEVERLYAGTERARTELGWTPVYAGREGFARALEATAAWFQEPSNLRRYKAGQYNI
jgi:hypothetical protein